MTDGLRGALTKDDDDDVMRKNETRYVGICIKVTARCRGSIILLTTFKLIVRIGE